MRLGLALALAIGVLAAGNLALGLVAGAEAKTITTVDMTGTSYGSGIAGTHGNIVSKRRACLSARVVRITAVVADKRVGLSPDVSSLNGYWGGEGASDAPDEYRVRMKPKRISKRTRCSGDRDSYILRQAQPRTTFPSQIQYFQLAYASGQVGVPATSSRSSGALPAAS